MNIYEHRNTSGKSKQACGYCRTEGHNINECPQVALDWAYWKDYKVPVNAGNTCNWYNKHNPKYWGEWYTKCQNAYHKQLKYQEKKKAGKKRVVGPRKCGFCGEAGHNRRDCPTMKQFLADAYKANENWRRAAYDKLVGKLGISVGAAIRVKESSWRDDSPEHVALITQVNWDKLSLACALDGWNSRDYAGQLTVAAIVNGQTQNIKFEDSLIKPEFVRQGWYGVKYVGKIANAPKPLDPSWVTDYREAFDYLVKKRSFERLEEIGFVALVDKWK